MPTSSLNSKDEYEVKDECDEGGGDVMRVKSRSVLGQGQKD